MKQRVIHASTGLLLIGWALACGQSAASETPRECGLAPGESNHCTHGRQVWGNGLTVKIGGYGGI